MRIRKLKCGMRSRTCGTPYHKVSRYGWKFTERLKVQKKNLITELRKINRNEESIFAATQRRIRNRARDFLNSVPFDLCSNISFKLVHISGSPNNDKDEHIESMAINFTKIHSI